MRFYGTLLKKTEYWYIEAEPHVRIRLKDMFKKIGKSDTGNQLRLKDTLDICKDLEWFLQRYPLQMSKKDETYLRNKVSEFNVNQTDLENILLPTYTPKEVKLAVPLRPYQNVGVDLLRRKKKLLIGDDVGLGKTAIGIGGIVDLPKPALVVCQTHLPQQWKDQCQKFSPELRVHIITTGKPYTLPEADVYICSYSKIAKWEDIFGKGLCKLVIFDEIQELRHSGSQKYEAAKTIADYAEYCLGLSATPIYNFGSESYPIFNVIQPGCLGSWQEFLREWCGTAYDDGKAKVKDPKAFGSFLRENFLMIRRTREEVGQQLPEINKIVHNVGYDHKVAEESEDLLKQIASRLVNSETSFVERGQAARELDMKARYITGVAKANEISEYVKLFLENGEKVLLAGWHRDVYDIWSKNLAQYKPVLYTGSENPNQKNRSKEDFVKGDSQIMFISLRSGIGLDGLQDACSVVVFGELDWSPAVHEQVIGRLQRPGQKNRVTAVFLASEHGTDPLMIDLLGLKASQSHGILNPDNNDIVVNQSDENRLKTLAQNILNRQPNAAN